MWGLAAAGDGQERTVREKNGARRRRGRACTRGKTGRTVLRFPPEAGKGCAASIFGTRIRVVEKKLGLGPLSFFFFFLLHPYRYRGLMGPREYRFGTG